MNPSHVKMELGRCSKWSLLSFQLTRRQIATLGSIILEHLKFGWSCSGWLTQLFGDKDFVIVVVIDGEIYRKRVAFVSQISLHRIAAS